MNELSTFLASLVWLISHFFIYSVCYLFLEARERALSSINGKPASVILMQTKTKGA